MRRSWMLLGMLGCGSAGVAPGDAGPVDAGPPEVDAGPAPVCLASFGTAIPSQFGRLDGTLVGMVRPQDQSCPQPNGTHLNLQVQMNGAAYRMLVNLQSDDGGETLYLSKAAPLPAPAWSEGWHSGVALDYAADLGVHTADFVPHPLAELNDLLVPQVQLGDHLSIYALGFGSGGHDIHKMRGSHVDGAVVLHPDTDHPTFLLFRFDDSPAF